MEDTFNELKETLKLEMEKAQWVKQQGRERLLEKIDSLKLSLPAISYFKERNSLYNKYNIPQVLFHTHHYYFIQWSVFSSINSFDRFMLHWENWISDISARQLF